MSSIMSSMDDPEYELVCKRESFIFLSFQHPNQQKCGFSLKILLWDQTWTIKNSPNFPCYYSFHCMFVLTKCFSLCSGMLLLAALHHQNGVGDSVVCCLYCWSLFLNSWLNPSYFIMLCKQATQWFLPISVCVCLFQWGKNKSQMWHGCCSLPVLPASSDYPAGRHNCHIPCNHTACQPDRRPAGCVLHLCLLG